ncbi:hypothetical protein [Raoultella ornithinolytica]|uniref:hypothetical protein n=1 Tax=Raoultella ornithinolytica TaxID=54291 RepID=UPI0015DD2A9A|nr:hypothetical protein [Raoultella ornithinolytica]QLK22153.1 hypothetical protein GPJ66_15740 [Raoultella ornithinolytica]
MMVKVHYTLAKRVDFPEISIGTLLDKNYDSFVEANIPGVGDTLTLQYGEVLDQSHTFKVTKVLRSIWNDGESYTVVVEGV